MRRHTILTCALIGSFAVVPAGAAIAQDALGSGDALDANPNVQGRRNRQSRQVDYRSRNLVVTGDVADGREFRGNVGYAASDNFRGLLGSNDLYRFRAGSAYSSNELVGLGRSYEQLRFGFTMSGAGEVAYRRSGSQQDFAGAGLDPRYPTASPANRIVVDRMTLSRALVAEAQRRAEPEVVGRTRSQDGEALVFQASPVQGIVVQPELPQFGVSALTSFDRARLLEDADRGVVRDDSIGLRFDTRFADAVPVSERVEAGAVESRVDLRSGPDYAAILERIADRFAKQENVDLQIEKGLLEELDAEFEELRKRLQGEEETGAPTPETGEDTGEPTEDGAPTVRPPRTVEDFGVLLQHGQRVDRLATDDEGRFNELLASAEQRLMDGEYFWAERRFERALRFIPGHPMATAGLGHARIGAGMQLPAALALKNLLTQQPEMIDVLYDEALLPNRLQLDAAIREIEQRLEATEDQSDVGLFGFLLAYIGHQIDDSDLVARGLDVMRTNATDDRTLVDLLDELWRSEPTPEK